MSRTCEHCTFWRGNESSSRAECGNDDVMGTTAHNDTCKHFTAKAWAGNPSADKIDEQGKIIHWGRGLMFITQGNSDSSFTIPVNTPMYITPDGKYTTTPNGGDPAGHVVSIPAGTPLDDYTPKSYHRPYQVVNYNAMTDDGADDIVRKIIDTRISEMYSDDIGIPVRGQPIIDIDSGHIGNWIGIESTPGAAVNGGYFGPLNIGLVIYQPRAYINPQGPSNDEWESLKRAFEGTK